MKEIPAVLCVLLGVVTVMLSMVLFFEMQDNRALSTENRELKDDIASIRGELGELVEIRRDFESQREFDASKIAELTESIEEMEKPGNAFTADPSAAFLTRAYSDGKYVGPAWIVPSKVSGEDGESSIVPVIQLAPDGKPVQAAAADEPETPPYSETTIHNYPNQYYYNYSAAAAWSYPIYYRYRPGRPDKPSRPDQPQSPASGNTTVVANPGNTPWMPAARVVPVQPPTGISYHGNAGNVRNNSMASGARATPSGFIPPSGQTRPQVLGRSAGSIRTYPQ